MVGENSFSDRAVNVLLYLILLAMGLSCVLPFVHVIALSLSSHAAVSASRVGLWPIGTHLDNYRYIMADALFINSFGISILRVIVGVSIGLLIAILTAYPLSRDHIYMPGRTTFKVLLLFGMMFSGGLIPFFLALRSLGLLNKFWVLVIPPALNIFHVILVINFFRGIPSELWEAAVLDGASHFQVLFRIFVPISKPVLATVTLFSAVQHWNSWFDGIIFLKEASQWPLQSYLYSRVTTRMLQWQTAVSAERAGQAFLEATPEGLATAMILIATIPIVLVYPLLQRYFVTGLTLGSLKE
ncbi:MAG: carbohydrate ABC transporter permease [Anaerolineae bacterium]|nr:carbohydrate ABC transporter permease [Anaerolineae bacterium]MDW8099785.1 carbohydrate ABC transporter permease [Anaerolineae bacterium]